MADVRALVEARPHPEILEPPELREEVNARVFSPMVRELIAAGVRAGEFSVPDIDFAAACCMAAGMEAVRIIREDPSRRQGSSTLDIMARRSREEGQLMAEIDTPELDQELTAGTASGSALFKVSQVSSSPMVGRLPERHRPRPTRGLGLVREKTATDNPLSASSWRPP